MRLLCELTELINGEIKKCTEGGWSKQERLEVLVEHRRHILELDDLLELIYGYHDCDHWGKDECGDCSRKAECLAAYAKHGKWEGHIVLDEEVA